MIVSIPAGTAEMFPGGWLSERGFLGRQGGCVDIRLFSDVEPAFFLIHPRGEALCRLGEGHHQPSCRGIDNATRISPQNPDPAQQR
ncbi:MAG: hypothetical protein JWL84_3359 [Rhodospirillales bacterium]|nr:hypothetical protein [Rhodospirillales bacterium]